MSYNRIPSLEGRVCTMCENYSQEWDGEQGEIYCGEHCSKFPKFSGLKTFPFKKVMPCFSMDFWHSEFADLLGCFESDPRDKFGPDLLKSTAFTEFLKVYNKPGIPPGSGKAAVEELRKRNDYRKKGWD